LSASYAGSSAFTPAAASQDFNVVIVSKAGSPPGPPTIGTATAGDGRITSTFTPPSSDGGSPIMSYTLTCTPIGGGMPVTATSGASPITDLGLTDGVTYTCTVTATNSAGPGAPSAASNPVTPASGPVLVQKPIPTLSGWSELILMGLLALLACIVLRDRQRGTRRAELK
jgi:large repetitive protein